MQRLVENLLGWHIRVLIARARSWILLASIFLTAGAVWAIATHWNINTNFKALLPQTAPAVQALDEVDARVGGGSSLFIVIDSPDLEANKAFARVYAEKLRAQPEVALAHFHNDRSFFEKQRLLYLDAETLRSLHDQLKKRIKDAKKRAIFGSLRKPKPAKPITIKTPSQAAYRTYKEYLTSDDGYALVIIVRFIESSTNLKATNKLLDHIKDLATGLDPPSFHPDMKVEFGGSLAKRQARYRSIVGDLKLSAVFTVLGLLLIIGLYFRRARAVLLVLGPLIMSVSWTLGFAFLVFGELTAITAFIFAILLGLGIDFGIHLLNAYDFERAQGHEPVEALARSYLHTGKATAIGALTTFVTFAVLSQAQFQGLSQFGQVASLGVSLTLVAMFYVLPSMILVFHAWWPHTPKQTTPRPATSPRKAPRALLAILLLASTAISVWSFQAGAKIEFEERNWRIGEYAWPWEKSLEQKRIEGLMKWRARNRARYVLDRVEHVRRDINPKTFRPLRRQTTVAAQYSNATQGRQSSLPTILLFDTPEAARSVASRLTQAEKDGKFKEIRSANSIYTFMPGTSEQISARMAEIQKLEQLIKTAPRKYMASKDLERLEELEASIEDARPFTIYDLPDWTKRLFREAGPQASPPHPGEAYAFEKLVYVTEKRSLGDGKAARAYLKEINTYRGEEPFRIGSQAYIYTAMLDEIRTDGARMMGYALILVIIILSLAFASPIRAIVALLPLVVGGLWTAGICHLMSINLDFFNIIILPALVGIAIDDGVHFYMRYLELGRGSLGVVMRQVGAAIVMTSMTSMIGFGGLAITSYPGLQSIGHMAMAGLCATLFATLLILPPLIALAEALDLKFIAPREAQDS